MAAPTLKELSAKLSAILKGHNVKLSVVETGNTITLMAEAKLADGTDVYTDAPEFAQGVAVYTKGDGDTPMAVPEGEYPMADGKILVVDAEGKVADIKEAPAGATPEELSAIVEEVATALAAAKTELASVTAERDAERTKYAELEKQLKLSQAEVIALKKAPATESVTAKLAATKGVAAPTKPEKHFTQQTYLERVLKNMPQAQA